MPGVCENWGPETPEPSRRCVVCGSITLTKASSYCFSHYQPEPEQGKLSQEEDEPLEAIVDLSAEREPAQAEEDVSKQYANKLRMELREGRYGRPLTEEQVCSHLARLRRRALVLPARYRDAELAKIRELEVIAKERLESRS